MLLKIAFLQVDGICRLLDGDATVNDNEIQARIIPNTISNKWRSLICIRRYAWLHVALKLLEIFSFTGMLSKFPLDGYMCLRIVHMTLITSIVLCTKSHD